MSYKLYIWSGGGIIFSLSLRRVIFAFGSLECIRSAGGSALLAGRCATRPVCVAASPYWNTLVVQLGLFAASAFADSNRTGDACPVAD